MSLCMETRKTKTCGFDFPVNICWFWAVRLCFLLLIRLHVNASCSGGARPCRGLALSISGASCAPKLSSEAVPRVLMWEQKSFLGTGLASLLSCAARCSHGWELSSGAMAVSWSCPANPTTHTSSPSCLYGLHSLHLRVPSITSDCEIRWVLDCSMDFQWQPQDRKMIQDGEVPGPVPKTPSPLHYLCFIFFCIPKPEGLPGPFRIRYTSGRWWSLQLIDMSDLLSHFLSPNLSGSACIQYLLPSQLRWGLPVWAEAALLFQGYSCSQLTSLLPSPKAAEDGAGCLWKYPQGAACQAFLQGGGERRGTGEGTLRLREQQVHS